MPSIQTMVRRGSSTILVAVSFFGLLYVVYFWTVCDVSMIYK